MEKRRERVEERKKRVEERRKGVGGGTGGKEIRGPYYDRLGRSGAGYGY